jgi:hypothetical protein
MALDGIDDSSKILTLSVLPAVCPPTLRGWYIQSSGADRLLSHLQPYSKSAIAIDPNRGFDAIGVVAFALIARLARPERARRSLYP